jgi:hypothetical protein
MKRPPPREKRRPRSRQTADSQPSPVIDLDQLRERGDWKAVADIALRCGDPQLWPDVEKAYREHPDYRCIVLLFLPLYWKEHEATVAPLLKEALRDPKACQNALHAASLFPALLEDVVACLQAPELLHWTGPDSFVATLACYFGLLEAPPDVLLRFAWGGVDPIMSGVRSELIQRYGVDLDELLSRLYDG